ncbi:MAG: hypothetical protein Q8R20_03185 [Nanoarchaeota archaeon]|nr:hypothetical protein [Nanoarchaeota archaeon]
MERGFVPIIVILAVVAVLGAASSFIVVSKLKENKQGAVTVPVPETVTPIPKKISEAFRESSREPSGDSIEVREAYPVRTITRPVPTPSRTKSTEITGLEREITVLFEAGNTIGPDHYTRLASGLDKEASLGTSPTLIEKLRNMLEALNPNKVPSLSSASSSPSSAPQACADDIKPQLTNYFTDFSKIQKITAPGSPSSEGPKGHSFVWTGGARVPVYAPIAMTLDSGAYAKNNAESPAQYLLFFIVNNNCNYQVKFDHIDEPISAIREQLPGTPKVGDSRTTPFVNKIQFQAGDLIGYTTGNLQSGNWDFGLYYMKEKGVLGREYNSYGMHGYAVCWTDFYAGEKQAQYRGLLEGPKLLCSF